jgi:hypothetical protein
MNPLTSLLFLLSIPLAATSTLRAQSQIRFAQDNQLGGELLAFTGDRIVWKSPVLEEPASFLVKKVMEVSLPAETPSYEADHEAVLKLRNGDVVHGQLLSVTDEEIQLGTWYAGTMTFRRVMVDSLSINDRPTLFFRGPSGLDGWVQTGARSAWTYQSNALRINGGGSIGRMVETSDQCRFAFTVEWRGEFRFAVNFFSNDLNSTEPETGYRISFNRQIITLSRMGATQRNIGNIIQNNQVMSREQSRIEIRANRENGQVTLLVDDRVVGNWQDPEPEKGKDSFGLQFTTNEGASMKLSHIEVSGWDGHTENLSDLPMNGLGQFNGRFNQLNRLPEPDAAENPAPEEGGERRMALRNGDHITGEVLSISDGMIKIKTLHSEIALPVSRLRNITLKEVALEVPKLNAGDVRAWFADGSSLVFRLESMDDGTITGYSQTFGTARFKASAFNRIEFNIHDIPFQAIRGNKSW